MSNIKNIPALSSALRFIRVRWVLRLGVIVMVFSLLACSNNDGLDDLRAFTEAERAKKASAIEPLPSLRATEVFKYTASSIVSPFSQENVLPEIKATLEISPILPDQDRIRQPLEYFPLDSLKMVGTLEQNDQMFAVIFAPDDTVHSVSKGNYAGTQLGEIIEVLESEIVLEETVKLRNGRWEKRKVSLALIEEK
jgi:type IV pilus assembly protein PilP